MVGMVTPANWVLKNESYVNVRTQLEVSSHDAGALKTITKSLVSVLFSALLNFVAKLKVSVLFSAQPKFCIFQCVWF